ncbi:unnamed protein product [Cladocopium goreaui]|uniref:Hydroxyacylglutathione hydrolase (Glyoxalase II ) (Glx II) n=1 Tax=Cladocopium goreaui TaxID=2562237 RepID=A0A9P1BR59_9DINO|nr:unnamed protein product [Cladocopium goreaui]
MSIAVLDCGPVRVHQLQLGPMSNYQYVLDNGKVAVTVDAAWDIPKIRRYVEKKELRLVAGLYTHGHFDHVGGKFPGSSEGPVQGALELQDLPLYLGVRDIEAAELQTQVAASKWHPLKEGDKVQLLGDDVQIWVIDTPGHTLGGVTFWVEGNFHEACGEGLMFTGDTLFLKNVGRTDLPGGDPTSLQRSLARLSGAVDGAQILPGHSYDSPPKRADLATVRRTNSAMKAAMARFPSPPPLPWSRSKVEL